MRFLHTADWHLGRYFHNVSLLEDQWNALSQILEIAKDASVDAVVVAGDVYDRAVPPPDAVRMLDEIIAELVIGLKVPVIMIAGNHDSGDRLNFASRLLATTSCHIFGRLNGETAPVTIEDADGPVHFVGLPYAEPALVREHTGAEELHSHDLAMSHLTAAAAKKIPRGHRSVLVGHCFVAGGSGSESERPLSVGGAGNVSASCFAPFNYTALGHLHRPQRSADGVHYSGSLLKYSFSEIDHQKSVNIVELDARGKATTERIPIKPRRDLRLVEGTLKKILEGPAKGESPDDYLLVRLTDTHALLDPIGKLRAVYPNVLHLERPGLERAAMTTEKSARPGQGDKEILAAFFDEVTGETLSPDMEKAVLGVIDDVRRTQREAT